MTTRDMEIVEFIRQFKIASSKDIQDLFFPSQSACQKRLKVLHDNKQVKRIRDSINSEYIYFIKQPKQFKHSLTVTNFYARLVKTVEVINFKIEPTYDDVRPDAFFGYKKNGKPILAFLEVELSNKGFDQYKYLRMDYKKFFPIEPVIFLVTDRPTVSKLSIVTIKTDLSDFRVP